METISEEYRRLNEELHKTSKEYGTNAERQYHLILPLLRDSATTSILDYGCGKGELQKLLPFQIQQYDPAIPEHNRPPKPAKVVVCSDVMEHVEEQHVEAVLDHIQALATEKVIFIIAIQPSQRVLADGRNTHVTLKPPMWWLTELVSRWDPTDYHREENGILFVGRPHGYHGQH